MKTIGVALGVSLLAIFGGGTAHADGYLTPGEEALGDAVSDGLCNYLDTNGVNRTSIGNLFDILYPQREIADGSDVADVVNYTVYNYCPRHWDSIVAFGEGARS